MDSGVGRSKSSPYQPDLSSDTQYDNPMTNPKSKVQKRLDKAIRLTLTDVCKQALNDIAGFQWLTHQADYSDFPSSLVITCVFETEEECIQAERSGNSRKLQKLIQSKLLKIGVKFTAINSQVRFDSEEACNQQHTGDWKQRLGNRR